VDRIRPRARCRGAAVRRSRHAEAVRLVRRLRHRGHRRLLRVARPDAGAQARDRRRRGRDHRWRARDARRADAGRGHADLRDHGHRHPQGARQQRAVGHQRRLRVQPRPHRRDGRVGRARSGRRVGRRGPVPEPQGPGHGRPRRGRGDRRLLRRYVGEAQPRRTGPAGGKQRRRRRSGDDGRSGAHHGVL
ncbi:MAG: Membrane protein, distant similarity to thiosulphate:quinone oxidoreductase DoxD, partial [uncultured Solirubrobacteraceae bacterium]